MNLLHNSNHLNNQTNLSFRNYLLVWLAPGMISLCNFNPATREIVSLKSFNCSAEELENIDLMLPDAHDLKLNYAKKILAFSGPNFSLVPDAYLNDTELIENYYNLNFSKAAGETILKDHIAILDTSNVYSLDKSFQKFSDQVDFELKMHSVSSYLHAVCSTVDVAEQHSVYIDIQNTYFSVTLLQYGKLQLCNSFQYKSPDDMLYHILNISKHFNIDPDQNIYRLSGVIYQISPLYDLLYKYIRHPEFISSPANLNYHSSLSSIPQHIYYNVFALALCVS